jgi:hypothetical protein
MPFGQPLFHQPQQMPIARHHNYAGLLPVPRCVANIGPQRKFSIAHDVNAIHVPVAPTARGGASGDFCRQGNKTPKARPRATLPLAPQTQPGKRLQRTKQRHLCLQARHAHADARVCTGGKR